MRESVIYQDILQEGLAQKAQEIAIKMIHKGIDIETIVDFTGLTIEQVQQLQAKTLANQAELYCESVIYQDILQEGLHRKPNKLQ